MKLSVSLPDEDVVFLDTYAAEQGLTSRSSVLHQAVRLLRGAELGAAYEESFIEWDASGESEAWDATAGDGLAADAPG